MLKSKRWPWLTDGWEVVEDVLAEQQSKMLSCYNVLPEFFDLSNVYSVYVPKDNIYDKIHRCSRWRN